MLLGAHLHRKLIPEKGMPRKSADMIVSIGISGAAPAGAASLLPTGDDMFAVSDLEARIRKLLADIEGQ